MAINTQKFYANYRDVFGRIKNQKTVDTIDAILTRAEIEGTPPTHQAYMFATSLHEARDRYDKYDFYPIMERGSYQYIVKQYWYNSRVRRWLGNDTIDEAFLYRGRGLVQLTGETNYERFNIQDDPDKALEPAFAVEILFTGMKMGIFTGKKLSDYLTPFKKDYIGARRIINGVDKAGQIADYARKFEYIISKSQ